MWLAPITESLLVEHLFLKNTSARLFLYFYEFNFFSLPFPWTFFDLFIEIYTNSCFHYVKSVQIKSYFWSVFSPNTGKYGPEINPYLDTFDAVFSLFIIPWMIIRKTSKFEWTLDDIRIEKIILAPIWATKHFLEVSALLNVIDCHKLQSCAISRETNNATLRCNLGPIWGLRNFFHEFYLY